MRIVNDIHKDWWETHPKPLPDELADEMDCVHHQRTEAKIAAVKREADKQAFAFAQAALAANASKLVEGGAALNLLQSQAGEEALAFEEAGPSTDGLCSGSDCATTDLVPYDGPTQGRIEVYRDGVWGTICSHGWTYWDADLFCQYLGYPGAYPHAFATDAYFGEGTGPILLAELDCTAESPDIFHCPSQKEKASSGCAHGNDAGVVCIPKHVKCNKPASSSKCSSKGGAAASAVPTSSAAPVPMPLPTAAAPEPAETPAAKKLFRRARNKARHAARLL